MYTKNNIEIKYEDHVTTLFKVAVSGRVVMKITFRIDNFQGQDIPR